MERLSDTIAKALALAYEAHRGQTDKGGMPYILHPVTVALTLAKEGFDEHTIAAGLLHDVMEDSGCTPDDLKALGIPDEVTEALRLLTHDSGTPYADYIRSLSGNPIARAVKTADLLHNSDHRRLENIGENDRLRLKKYAEALRILHDS